MTAAQQISSYYDEMEKAQKAQLLSQYQQSVNAYQSQLERAPAQYQQLKNEAYVNNALAERARRENIANMGLSGVGGTSQTLEQRNTGRLLGTLGDASRQQQDYTDNVNLALANLGVKHNADLQSLAADNAAQRSAALTEQARFEAQYNQAQQKNVFDQAYNLYKKKLITAAQFTAMTGISLKKSTTKKTTAATQTAVPYIGSYLAQLG